MNPICQQIGRYFRVYGEYLKALKKQCLTSSSRVPFYGYTKGIAKWGNRDPWGPFVCVIGFPEVRPAYLKSTCASSS